MFMTLIGGAGSFIGPMLGSVIYTFLQAVVKMYTVYWPLTIGTIILLIVLFLPGGVLGLDREAHQGAARGDATRAAGSLSMAAILEVTDLHKHFGGIHVTRHVNFSMQEGEQSAIIGPNGAGKSTFMNLLTGYHRCDPARWCSRGGTSPTGRRTGSRASAYRAPSR